VCTDVVSATGYLTPGAKLAEERLVSIFRRRPKQPRSTSIQVIELLGSDPGLPLLNAVGESNYQAALETICGRRGSGWTEVSCEITAVLVPEPSNPYDSNAVMVTVGG
jgi:hypothetical protein